MKKALLTIGLCLLATLLFSQENVKTIFGIVSDDFGVLRDVNVSVQGADASVISDANGKYKISAKEGDVLVFTRMGMNPMEIAIEDVTRILNVKMFEKVEKLDGVTVTKSLKSQQELAMEYMTNPKVLKTAFGYWDADATSFSLRIIDKEHINPGAPDLALVIQSRFPGIRVQRSSDPKETLILLRSVGSLSVGGPAGYDVDGLLMAEFPFQIDPQNVERIGIVSSLNGLARYGTFGRGGIIVINTKSANYQPKDENGEIIDTARRLDNKYFGDALADQGTSNAPTYLKELYAVKTENEAQTIYKENAEKYSGSYFFVLDAYNYFASKWNNQEFADGIVKDNWKVFENNPVALKSLAYVYQAEGEYNKANDLYKEIFIQRPHYAQSYLDLANSYSDIGENQKAAAIYARYGYLLEEDFIVDDKRDFNLIMERELNNLIKLKGEELLSKRDLKKLTLDDEFDGTRLVFEWADSEAEFELQFVNPQQRYFNWNHSMRDNADRIKDEKSIGFSTEEYLIDEALQGNWQVNVKYLGNKSLTATYLKATIYHNYGSASQRSEVKVFKLSLLNVNQQLFKVSNTGMVVSK